MYIIHINAIWKISLNGQTCFKGRPFCFSPATILFTAVMVGGIQFDCFVTEDLAIAISSVAILGLRLGDDDNDIGDNDDGDEEEPESSLVIMRLLLPMTMTMTMLPMMMVAMMAMFTTVKVRKPAEQKTQLDTIINCREQCLCWGGADCCSPS